MESTYSSGADLQEIIQTLYKKYQEIVEDYDRFSCQSYLFVTALKNRLYINYSVETLRQSRIQIGVRTLHEVRALFNVQWSSDSENTGSTGNSTNSQGTLELFLDLVDRLRELEVNLTSLLPEHVKIYCQDELSDWRIQLLEGSDFSHLEKEKFTLNDNDKSGYAGVVSLLPVVIDIAYNVFQILNEYLSARKVTPYRPQLLSLASIPDDENEEVFVTAQSDIHEDKENNNSKSPISGNQPSRLPRKEHEPHQVKQRRKMPYSKFPRKSPRQKTATRPPPQRLGSRQPSVIELGKGPMIRQTSRLTQQQFHPKQSKYTMKQEIRSLSPAKYITPVRSPRMKTPLKRLHEKYDHVRFPNIEKVVHSGQTDWKNLQDVKNAQNYSQPKTYLPYRGTSPHTYPKGQLRYTKSPIISQSLPHALDKKAVPTPIQSSYDPKYRQRRSPYPAVPMEARRRHVSMSSQDSADVAPVSVVYHGSTVYNYPGDGATEMDYTNRAIQRVEERLFPQIESLKNRMKQRDIRQKDNTNILQIVEDKLKKLEDEIEDIKTRQLLHNYYLRDFHRVLTNKDLDIIKDHVAYRDMTELGIKLGLSEIDVEDVKEQANKPREQVFQMLLVWRNKVGKYATLDLIIEVLIKMKRRDTTTLIINDMKNRS